MSMWSRSKVIALTLALGAGAGYLLGATLGSSAGAANIPRADSRLLPNVSGHASTVKVHGQPKPVCGSANAPIMITTHEIWTAAGSPYIVGCQVTVVRGGRITMEPGTVVKLGLNGLGDAFYVEPGGSITLAGTAKDQVVVTSFRDDSVGGSTAPSGSPPPNADYWWAILMDGDSTVRIDHADIRYGVSAVTEGTPSGSCLAKGRVNLSLMDSTITSPVVLGACDDATGSHYLVSGNRFTMASGMTAVSDAGFPDDSLHISSNVFSFSGSSVTTAMEIANSDIANVDFSGRASNTFHISSSPVSVNMASDTVPSNRQWTVTSPKHMSLTGSLDVEGSLSLGPGTSLTSGASISVGERGSLRVGGTSAHPVSFSGGASISTSGDSSLDIDHAVFTGALGGDVVQEVACGANDGGARVTISHSTIGGDVNLGNCDRRGGDVFTIEDNTFDNAKGFHSVDADRLVRLSSESWKARRREEQVLSESRCRWGSSTWRAGDASDPRGMDRRRRRPLRAVEQRVHGSRRRSSGRRGQGCHPRGGDLGTQSLERRSPRPGSIDWFRSVAGPGTRS